MNLSLKNPLDESNIIIVIDSLDGGGAEAQAIKLASGLKKENIKVSIFPLRSGGTLTKQAKNQNIEIVEGGFKSTRNIKSFIKGFLFLCKTIHSKKNVIVHTFLPFSNFVGSIAGIISGANYIITSRRGLIKLNYLKKKWRIFDKISNFLSDKIVVNAEAIIDEMLTLDSVNPNKVICIRNGINLEKFRIKNYDRNYIRSQFGLLESEFAWLKVANFSNIKGHKDLITSFKNLDSKYQAKLFLVGKDIGSLDELKTLVFKYGLQDRIKFLGFREDIPEILLSMDGYICASHTEGFSNAILEAMASGLPTIATNVGGNSEIIKNKITGLLFKPKDKNEIINTMIEIMENKPLSEKLSKEALKTVNEKYSTKKMVESYIDIYKKALK
tara:strand:- start:1627 stop:2781 length:1155 start_codon:yes stop_codon:yes gene_type:complete